MSRSHDGQGRIVYEYEPVVGSFFLRSRVGGCRTGCTRVTPELSSDDDTTLLFESRFESGNLYKAVQVGEYDYELWLRNDLYTNKHTQWFYFRVSNTRPNVTYRFTIVNLMKPDSLYNNGMRPVSYSEKDAAEKSTGWIRNGTEIKYYRNNIRYTCGKVERSYYSLTWSCQFSHTKDTVYFAHCYPYTYTDLQDYLNDIAVDPVRSKLCKQRVMCRTLAGNLVYILTITTPTKTPEEMKHRKAVVITARVHPGETNSSWMMKGFLDYLLGTSENAQLLRDTFVFKIIPMLNPDGVIVGNYRCSLAGRDLNRNYKTVLKDSFPSVWHTRTMMKKLLEERDIMVYCDLHGHSRRQNVFIYGCENRVNPQRRLRERIFPVMLSKNASDKFCFDSCKFKIQKSKEGTGRIVCWNLGIMNSFTLEATFCGSSLGKKKGFHFNTADFEEMGIQFCDTLLDYCDPDNSKASSILAELEEKMRQEILQHLKLREGQEAPELTEISLDNTEFSSVMESSDGGSDSSVSDGLPAHLQYIAQKQYPAKKKRLKTRKERDKHKSKDDNKKLQATPLTNEPEKKDLKPKAKASSKRPKSQDEKDRANAATSTRDLHDDKEKMKKSEGYLEALTNAYIRSGVLHSDQTQPRDDLSELPKYKYSLRKPQGGSAGRLTHGPDPSVPQVPAILDRRPSNRHILEVSAAQQRYQEQLQQDTDTEDPNNPLKQHPALDDDQENVKKGATSKPRRPGSSVSRCRSARSQSSLSRGWGAADGSMDENMILGPAQDHQATDLWATNAATTTATYPRQQDLSSDSRQSSAASNVRVKSAHRHGNRLPAATSVPYVAAAKHGAMVPPSTSDYITDRHKERITTNFNPMQQQQQIQQIRQQAVGKSQSHPQSSGIPAMYPTHSSERHHGNPTHASEPSVSRHGNQSHPTEGSISRHGNGPRPVDSKQAASIEMTNTMKSINEIRESLLDPEKRANLSPTTGHFVEHFIKKTDAEISDIAAELQEQLQTRQDTAPLTMLQQMFNLSASTLGGSTSSMANGSATTRKATAKTTGDAGRTTNGEFYPDPAKARASVAKPGSSAPSLPREPTSHIIQRSSRSSGHTSSANINMNNNATTVDSAQPRMHTSELTFTLPDDHSAPSHGYRTMPEPNTRGRSQEDSGGSGERREEVQQNNRVPSGKRASSSPTKISLVISRGHNQEPTSNQGNGNQGNFHAYHLTRQARPPMLRSMPQRR